MTDPKIKDSFQPVLRLLKYSLFITAFLSSFGTVVALFMVINIWPDT